MEEVGLSSLCWNLFCTHSVQKLELVVCTCVRMAYPFASDGHPHNTSSDFGNVLILVLHLVHSVSWNLCDLRNDDTESNCD